MAWCDSSAAKRWQGADKDAVLAAWRRSDSDGGAGARRVAEIAASQGMRNATTPGHRSYCHNNLTSSAPYSVRFYNIRLTQSATVQAFFFLHSTDLI